MSPLTVQRERVSNRDLLASLMQFDGPPESFLAILLAAQCEIALASAGAIMRVTPERGPEVLMMHPPVPASQPQPVWLAQANELLPRVASSQRTGIFPLRSAADLYGQAASKHLVMLPLRSRGQAAAAAAFMLETSDPVVVERSQERLELTSSLLALYEMRLTLQRNAADMKRLRSSVELLASVDEHERFRAAAMAMCNEVASRWNAARVSLGFVSGRYVRVQAMSHTEKFTRKMQSVQALEAAMEECLDQDVEVLYPAAPQAAYIYRATQRLAGIDGPMAVCSLPLRRGEQPVGVLTVERAATEPLDEGQIEGLRLAADLCTPRLAELHKQDRWVGAKAAAASRSALAWLVGAKHTWAKATAAAVLGLLIFMIFVKGADRVEASFVIDAVQRQVVPAPFDGYLKEVFVKPGDPVQGGQTLLARLDTAELELRLAEAQAEMASYLKEADMALQEGKTVEVQIGQAQARRIRAQIRLLQHQIDKAKIVAPIDGLVVTGDLERQLGAPAKQGDVLFEIAPLEALRADLAVPEERVAEVQVGQRGWMAAAAYPGTYMEFEVERLNPKAEVAKQRNVFEARARLLEVPAGLHLKPGMEGLAKIDVGRSSYGWLWTRELVNWLRMRLWF